MIFSVLLAALPADTIGNLLARMDVDQDGRVTAPEYAPFDDRGSFAAIDRNGDGSFDAQEFGTWIRLTDPARNQPHTGLVAPLPVSPVAPVWSLRRVWMAGVLLALTVVVAWRWRRP